MLDFNNLPAKDKIYYQDDATVVYCADNREILPLFPDKSFDLVLTDPPYGVAFSGKVNKNIKHTDGYKDSIGDDITFIQNIVIPIIELCEIKSSHMAIFSGNRNLWEYPPARDIGCFYVQFGGGVGPWGFGSVNLVLFYGTDPYLQKGLGSYPNSWLVNEISEKNGHPCPKPLGWIKKLLNRTSFPNDLILDPFLGSGTTAVAAKILGRKCVGIEISEKYCEIAAKRLSQSVMQLEIPKEEVKQGSFE